MFRPICHSVSQGSVLGLLLFLLYINDLRSCLNFSKATHCADNTNLIQIGSIIESLSITMIYDFSRLSSPLYANKIALNASKTEIIVFRSGLKLIGEMIVLLNGHNSILVLALNI